MIIADYNNITGRTDIEANVLKAFRGTRIYPSDVSLAENFTVYNKLFAEVLRGK